MDDVDGTASFGANASAAAQGGVDKVSGAASSGIGAVAAAGGAGVAGVAGVAAAAGLGRDKDDEPNFDDGEAEEYMTGAAAEFESDENVGEIDHDDTISEVDVYLAYGLHGQAEELLTKAIDKDDNNAEYQAKLLETYAAQGNSENYTEAASVFQQKFGTDHELWPGITWGNLVTRSRNT